MVKVCRKCNVEKELEAFSLHYKMPGGRRNCCKECEKAAEHRRRKEKAEEIRAYDRLRSKTPERIAYNTENTKRDRAKFPEKNRARAAVNKAIRGGWLVKEPCKVCGDTKTEGHHEDYDKPLEVVWLCSQHHKDTHRGLYTW